MIKKCHDVEGRYVMGGEGLQPRALRETAKGTLHGTGSWHSTYRKIHSEDSTWRSNTPRGSTIAPRTRQTNSDDDMSTTSTKWASKMAQPHMQGTHNIVNKYYNMEVVETPMWAINHDW